MRNFLIFICWILVVPTNFAMASETERLKELLSPVVAKLTNEKLSILNEYIEHRFDVGFDAGIEFARTQGANTTAPLNSTSNLIETRIDGDFEGWEGDAILKLMNSQIWQQDQYAYSYHYAYSPTVIIYKSGNRWMMKVDGMNQEIPVKMIK